MLTNLVLGKRPSFDNPLCAQVDPEIFFPDDEDDDRIPTRRVVANQSTYDEAKVVCKACDHIIECAEYAIRHEPQGFWGGLSPYQRRTARRRLNIRLENPY